MERSSLISGFAVAFGDAGTDGLCRLCRFMEVDVAATRIAMLRDRVRGPVRIEGRAGLQRLARDLGTGGLRRVEETLGIF
jgi:hypothetical protein